MTTAIVEQQLKDEIKEITVSVESRMTALVVTDQASLKVAVDLGREVKKSAKEIEEKVDKILKPLNVARNALLEEKLVSLAPFEAWEKKIKQVCTTFMDAEEKKAADKRRKDETEAQRIADEARLKHATEVEATQGREAATTLLEQPVAPMPIPKAPEPPKAAGASFTTRWKHEVVNVALIPREFLVVDDRALAAYATAMKEKAAVPGVRFFSEKSMGLRS
jgi:hypothetical protein